MARTKVPFGIWLLCSWSLLGLSVFAYAAAFRIWQLMWLDDVGHIVILASVPWLLLADALGMMRGYWHQTTSL